MSKAKRNRNRPKRKTAANLELGLTALRELRQRHEDRIEKLNTKIASQEGLIEVAREDEAEADKNEAAE